MCALIRVCVCGTLRQTFAILSRRTFSPLLKQHDESEVSSSFLLKIRRHRCRKSKLFSLYKQSLFTLKRRASQRRQGNKKRLFCPEFQERKETKSLAESRDIGEQQASKLFGKTILFFLQIQQGVRYHQFLLSKLASAVFLGAVRDAMRLIKAQDRYVTSQNVHSQRARKTQ